MTLIIAWVILLLSGISLYAFTKNLRQSANQALERLLAPQTTAGMQLHEFDHGPIVSVVIPAYNEADNIAACVQSILNSTDLSAEQLEVWVVDDQSTDQTLAIVEQLQATRQDPRLHVLPGQSRPSDTPWMGKNWACAQVSDRLRGEFVLFLDADVRLKPRCLETVITKAQAEQIDLLTFWMTIVCGCWAEWLAQPLIAALIAVGYPFAAVNDPQSDKVFAVGPFMLFRRSAYEQIGGHRSVAQQVVEDVELGRRIKQHGLKLWYGVGPDLAEVRMYRSFAALWEGWTKNWHLGSNRKLRQTLSTALITALVFVGPGVGLAIGLLSGLRSDHWSLLQWLGLGLGCGLSGGHYLIRQTLTQIANIPPRYWSLTGLGGMLVCGIMMASIVKTETGWGWTWRGRSLSAPLPF